MSERERWIVYPLLFLAIAASLKDKFVPSDINADTIECNKIRCRTMDTTDQITCQKLDCRISAIDGLNARQIAFVDEDRKTKLVLTTSESEQKEKDNATRRSDQINVLNSDGKRICSLGRVVLCERLLVAGRADTARLVTKLIGVVDDTGKPRVVLSTESDAQDDEQEGDTKAQPGSGRVQVRDPDGNSAVMLGTASDGGYIATSHGQHQRHILLTHNDVGSGLFFLGADGASTAISAIMPKIVAAQPLREPPADAQEEKETQPPDETTPPDTKDDTKDANDDP